MKKTTTLAALLVGALSLATLGCNGSTAATPPRSPAVSFGASTSDVSLSCTPDGMPRVIATHVVPTEGITAVARGSQIELRFGTTPIKHVLATLDAESLGIVGMDSVPVAATLGKDHGPVSVELPDHRKLVAWTEGTLEQGLRVKATTVTGDGAQDGAIDLGYEGSATGQPAVAVTRAGNGVIVFIESNDAGFQVVATPVNCAAP